MKVLFALLLAALLVTVPVAAQQSLAASEPYAAPTESSVAEAVSATIEDLEALIEAMYSELEALKAQTSPGVYEVLAVGTGAGLGFLASGVLMTGLVGPMTQGLAHSMGLSEMAAALLTASVTTIGIVSGTYAGGIYARNLVVD